MNRTLKDNLSFLVPWAATVVFLIILTGGGVTLGLTST